MTINILEHKKIFSVESEDQHFVVRFKDLNGSRLRLIFRCLKSDYNTASQKAIKNGANKDIWIEHDGKGGIHNIRIGKTNLEIVTPEI